MRRIGAGGREDSCGLLHISHPSGVRCLQREHGCMRPVCRIYMWWRGTHGTKRAMPGGRGGLGKIGRDRKWGERDGESGGVSEETKE